MRFPTGLGLAILGLALGSPLPTHATIFRCGPGDVRCLIAAIHTANANGQQNTIRLQAGLYTLTAIDNMASEADANGLPVITSPLTIRGAGAAVTSLARDASAPAFRFLEIVRGGFLTLQGVTLRGGKLSPAGGGGGISNEGALMLRECVLTANSSGYAGGVSNGGTLTLINSALTANTAYHNGGIYNSGILTITKSRITDNISISMVASITNDGGRVTITKSTIAHGSANHITGGLSNFAGTVVITATTFAHNSADGAGAIYNQGTLTITNSSFTDNTSYGSGAGTIINAGILLVTNTTFARNVLNNTFNESGELGIAITNSNTLILTNSTLADHRAEGPNRGGGSALASASGATTLVQNTLFARNVGSLSGAPDCVGVVTSLGNNLISDPTGCTITLQPSDLTGDPGVGAYRDNGTPGHGHLPLLATSPAIDAGDNAACPWRDQLRQRRIDIPGVGTSHCDIGAIEFQGEADGDDVAIQGPGPSPTMVDLYAVFTHAHRPIATQQPRL